MFGVVLPNRSFPLDISTFAQIDTTHWLLDMNHFVGESYDSITEICIFLINSFTLPSDKALAVYIQSPGSAFLFCGAVTVSCPSAVLSLPWPDPIAGSIRRAAAVRVTTAAATERLHKIERILPHLQPQPLNPSLRRHVERGQHHQILNRHADFSVQRRRVGCCRLSDPAKGERARRRGRRP
ncbi:hypothetical protein PHJA_000351200 [Phtheirospermum japonicum]|uniref:Hikeshi-like N-terminal domain-containing protein n=1 Tax=Phtheirospermum japonicum TaxID=374723 RepID=A0A830BA08_9LAMI|nr:hypothetical protein PHJA_000351200 [Phtheirospermum japonicum]